MGDATLRHPDISAAPANAASGFIDGPKWNKDHVFAGFTGDGQVLVSKSASGTKAEFTSTFSAQMTFSAGALFNDGTVANPVIARSAAGGQGFLFGPQYAAWSDGSFERVRIGQGVLSVFAGVDAEIGMASAAGANDVRLVRGAANRLDLRNGLSAQTFNVFTRYTSETDYQRLEITNAVGGATILTRHATQAAQVLDFGTGGTAWWRINTAGHLAAIIDNNNDIGTPGANRPRDIYASSSFTAGNSPSQTGSVRLPYGNTGGLWFRNSGNIADLPGINLYSHNEGGSDSLVIAGTPFIRTVIYGAEVAADIAAPAASIGVLYFRDNGAGKTQLVARFNTGAIQVIATEP